VKPKWDDVNARARGLSIRLLPRRRLEALAALPGLAELGTELDRAGYPEAALARAAGAPALSRSVRLHALSTMRLLTRWCGARSRFLLAIFEDEDRRSLRALVRGAAAGVSAERRLFGLVPTPALPERALVELARSETVAEIAGTLTVWKNPYGPAIGSRAGRGPTDLFRIEIEINRLFAVRAVAAARKADHELRRFTAESIDLENVAAVLALRREALDVEPEECFLEGGRGLDRTSFVDASRSEASTPLARALAGTPFARDLSEAFEDSSTFELAVIRLRLRALMARARREPLTAAPLLWFLYRLRAQTVDLGHIIWTLSLGASRTELVRHLVSA
jgi:vacuolar-type H+-ATPase subunit C/Vma6